MWYSSSRIHELELVGNEEEKAEVITGEYLYVAVPCQCAVTVDFQCQCQRHSMLVEIFGAQQVATDRSY
jgi:hypothetical protein